jgi:hypothetical protein
VAIVIRVCLGYAPAGEHGGSDKAGAD